MKKETTANSQIKLSGTWKGVKEKVMLVMILSGPWIEDDVGDIHDCEEDD